MHSSIEGSTIFYTLDGTKPSLTSDSVPSGDPIVLNTFGDTTVLAFIHTIDMVDSSIFEKTYHISERCEKPTLFPEGGTFAGSVDVTVTSSTPGATLYYTIDNTNPSAASPIVPLSGIVPMSHTATLKAVALKSGLASSPVGSAEFSILPKVATPIIKPDVNIFAISATITISCATENATIYYTTDGSTPSLSSLTMSPLSPQLVIDTPGTHLVQAFAAISTMLPSDVVSKSYTILARAPEPLILPPPGTYVDSVDVTFACENVSSADSVADVGVVYYTTDGKTTPTSSSLHVTCNQRIQLTGPGKFTVRAFVVMPHHSPSSIATRTFIVLRPPYDEHPVFPNVTLQRRPQLDVFVVEKNLPYTSYAQKR